MVWACFFVRVLPIASYLPAHVISACWYLQTSRSSHSLEAIANAFWLVEVHLDIFAPWKVPCLFTFTSLATVATGFSSRLAWCPRVSLSVEYLKWWWYPYVRSEWPISLVVYSWRSLCYAWCVLPISACLFVCTTGKIDFSGCHWMEVSLLYGWFFAALVACLLVYDWENRFLQLPLDGGQSLLRLALHCFSSMLVGVRLGKLVFWVAACVYSAFFAASCSRFCSMLVGVRLKKLIFRVASS